MPAVRSLAGKGIKLADWRSSSGAKTQEYGGWGSRSMPLRLCQLTKFYEYSRAGEQSFYFSNLGEFFYSHSCAAVALVLITYSI